MEWPGWDVLDRLVPWMVIPAGWFIWGLFNRVITVEKQLVAVIAQMEARAGQRNEDREHDRRDRQELRAAIEKLTTRLDTWFAEHRS